MNKINDLEKIIRISFNDKSLLNTALTHPSYLNENKTGAESYQRLEFLGDAVLELIVSEHLYKLFPDIQEGRLTEIRAALVRTETLAKCAQKFNLNEYILLSKGEKLNQGERNINILADCLEAIIGAIYLDSGFKKSELFFNSFIKDEIDEITLKKLYIDPKTKLQEHIQNKYKITPVYKLIKEDKKLSQVYFTIGVYVGKKLVGQGKGKNKKEAEHWAAVKALGSLSSL